MVGTRHAHWKDAGSETKPAPVVAGRRPLSNVNATPWTRKRRRLTRLPAVSNVAVVRAGAATGGGSRRPA